MQPCFTVDILVLQAEGLVSSSGCVGFVLQFAPAVIIPEQNQVAVFIGHLTRDADLVAMEIAGLLLAVIFCIRPITDLRQRFVTVRIGVEAV